MLGEPVFVGEILFVFVRGGLGGDLDVFVFGEGEILVELHGDADTRVGGGVAQETVWEEDFVFGGDLVEEGEVADQELRRVGELLAVFDWVL